MNLIKSIHDLSYHSGELSTWIGLVILSLGLCAIGVYIGAVIASNQHTRYRRWPIYRSISWCSGVISAMIATVGPLAHRAHDDFTIHMIVHLLLGMLAPLLMTLAVPITLLLRTLSVHSARRVSKLLRSWPSRLYTHPIFTSVLNIGGLWLLYASDLYMHMHNHLLLHLIVHIHVFVAGYLYTVSMIYIDPVSHRLPYLYRAVVMVLSLAGHGILSKYIYAHPPAGVPLEQAELGGMLMFYGGDIIDAMIIFILCLQWFKATRPRSRMNSTSKILTALNK